MGKFSELDFLDIAKECRKSLLNDAESGKYSLYTDILYQDKESALFKTHVEIYDLQWFIEHFERLQVILEDYPFEEKPVVLKEWASYFQIFLEDYIGTIADKDFLQLKLEQLQTISQFGKDWEKNLEVILSDFAMERKKMQNKLKALRKEKGLAII